MLVRIARALFFSAIRQLMSAILSSPQTHQSWLYLDSIHCSLHSAERSVDSNLEAEKLASISAETSVEDGFFHCSSQHSDEPAYPNFFLFYPLHITFARHQSFHILVLDTREHILSAQLQY